VDGVTRELPRPFLVLATQNPIEYEGTFPLPEAQLDRFLMRISLGYPDPEEEEQILKNLRREHPITKLEQVVEATRLLELQQKVWDVHVDDSLQKYMIQLVTATRKHTDLALGGSPRASLALYKASQALAASRGRDFVIPDDIQELFFPAMVHRLIVLPESELRGRSAERILGDVKEKVELNIGLENSETPPEDEK
jgi:MoxR-like ATPase